MNLKKNKGRIVISAFTAVLFILLAIASIPGFFGPREKLLEDGRWESTEDYREDDYERTTGNRDNKKRWHGEVEIVEKNAVWHTKEVVNMDHGVRNGLSTTTRYTWDGTVTYTVEKYYVLGIEVSKKYQEKNTSNASSPQDILYERYFWFHNSLQSRGFDSLYVREFMDTLMIILDSYEFTLEDFNEYYADAVIELEETPRDSLISFNTAHLIFKGLERIKSHEYRMAVIDRYLLGATSTFEVLQEHYPNYFIHLEEYEVTMDDFEKFSFQMDSILATYSPLDIEDPYFTDSVDTRLYRAIEIIGESGETEKSAMIDIKELAGISRGYSFLRDQVIRKINLGNNMAKMEPWDVAEVVMADIIVELEKADMIKYLVLEAWMKNKGEIGPPVLTTEYLGSFTGSEADIRGLVLENGGDAVTDRGIVWANQYKPALSDNVENSGSGIGEFMVSLSGLLEGESYYARAFATNSAGTAYGPMVEFKAGSSVGIDSETGTNPLLLIYPNPTSSLARIDISLEESTEVTVLVYDMNGRLQASQFEGSLPAGGQTVGLNVSDLQEGLYLVEVRAGQKKLASGQLVVER
jgi:hypothetical protein